MAPHLGGQALPPKTILGREYAFSSQTRETDKRAYYQNYCIDSNQILHSIKTTKCPSWVVPTHVSQIQKTADGYHLGKVDKSPYLSRGTSDFNDISHDDAVRTYCRTFLPLKFVLIKIQDGGWPPY